MILVMDVGNNRTVLGLFVSKKLIAEWRLATDKNRTVDEYGIVIKAFLNSKSIDYSKIEAVVLSSVVPPLTSTFAEMSRTYFGVDPLVVGPGIRTGLSLVYENPKEVGADRVVNAVAAINIYGPPLIVVDFGTAITFCAINKKGDYLGGAMFPGLGIAAEALFLRAAKLPRVELQAPPRIIGKNTVNSIQSGLIYGYTDMVDGLIQRLSEEMRCEPKVVATGELSSIVAPYSQRIMLTNPVLTLEGLRIIYELNCGR